MKWAGTAQTLTEEILDNRGLKDTVCVVGLAPDYWGYSSLEFWDWTAKAFEDSDGA